MATGNNQSNTRFLDLNTVKVIAHEVSRKGYQVEATVEVHNGFGIVVDGVSIKISENVGTIFLTFEGSAFGPFAQIHARFATEDVLAAIIAGAIDKAQL